MRRSHVVSLCFLLGGHQLAQAQPNPLHDFVLTKTDAVAMLPPRLVCGPRVVSAAWSPDGQRLLLLREESRLTPEAFSKDTLGTLSKPAPVERQLVAWNAADGKAQVLWTDGGRGIHVEQYGWMGKGPSAAALTKQELPEGAVRWQVLTLGASSPQVVATLPSTGHPYLGVSSARAVAAVATTLEEGGKSVTRFLLYGPGRALGAAQSPGELGVLQWAGETAYYGTYRRDAQGGIKRAWGRVDWQSGGLVPSEAPPKEPASSHDLIALNSWLEAVGSSEEPMRAQYGRAGTENGSLSPRGDMVYFTSQGAAFVRSLARVSKQAFTEALKAALKAQAMNDAKQSALAFTMFAVDNDDMFPTPSELSITKEGGTQVHKVGPYAKNQSMLNRFVYTFRGGSTAGLDPAKTEMGYVPGPGGRAVAYLDGSVTWVPDP